MRRLLLIPLSLLLLSWSVITGTVIQVKDGDTLVVLPDHSGQAFVCRLYGIDAPEVAKQGKPAQPYGDEAKRFLKGLVLGKTVHVHKTGQKTYGRDVCLLYVNGEFVNVKMVEAGYAWAYREYLKRPYASEFIQAEEEARKKRYGLWREHNPVPPWEYRKRR